MSGIKGNGSPPSGHTDRRVAKGNGNGSARGGNGSARGGNGSARGGNGSARGGNGGDAGHVLITGGAGFIGSNLAHHFLSQGRRVVLLDTLDRDPRGRNAAWLARTHGDRVKLVRGDVRDADAVRTWVADATEIFHFAAQVAVTTSLDDPIEDFEVNARGTLHVLEAARARDVPPPVVFTSTNKVYGDLADVPLRVRGDRYEPEDAAVRAAGISEARPLDFHSPYGCSKGAADQYVLDWARTFGVPATVFRMSCIYGPRQFGNEDQGWVAHFLIRALEDAPITLFGDGRQVRDILFVGDLVRAFQAAIDHIDAVKGRAFNIGGGPENAVSLLEILDRIEALLGRPPRVGFDAWRAADQRYYVSDTRAFREVTGWRPRVDPEEGLVRLRRWLTAGEVTLRTPRRAEAAPPA